MTRTPTCTKKLPAFASRENHEEPRVFRKLVGFPNEFFAADRGRPQRVVGAFKRLVGGGKGTGSPWAKTIGLYFSGTLLSGWQQGVFVGRIWTPGGKYWRCFLAFLSL